MKKTIKALVPTMEVFFDEDLYPRTQENWQTIYDYSESIKTGAVFPPIVLAMFKGKKVLVDGLHRLKAFRNLHIEKIPAIVLIGLSRNEIFEEAVKRNIAHGRVLSPYEKRLIILRLRAMKYKTDEICTIVQIPFDRIESFLGSNIVNSITGEQVVTKAPLEFMTGKVLSGNEIAKLIKSQKKLNVKDQELVLMQLRDLLKGKLINFKNVKISKLVNEIKGLLK